MARGIYGTGTARAAWKLGAPGESLPTTSVRPSAGAPPLALHGRLNLRRTSSTAPPSCIPRREGDGLSEDERPVWSAIPQ